MSFAIVAWSRQPGRSEVGIAERVVALLHDVALALDGVGW